MKGKIYRKITGNNNNRSYLGYLNKLVDEYNSTYHCSIGKKHTDTGYCALTKEIETNPKAPKFKVGDRIRITEYKNIFRKGHTRNCSREIIVIDSVLKTNSWTYRIKFSNREKMM